MKFKIGDICITQNSRVPLLNNNQIVLIVGINSGVTSYEGESCPYLIKRIDGFPHTSATCCTTGKQYWCARKDTYCAEKMLRRIVSHESNEIRKLSKKRPRKILISTDSDCPN